MKVSHFQHYDIKQLKGKITRTLLFKQVPNADVRPLYSKRLIDLNYKVRFEDAF